MEKITLISRYLLGFIFFVFGLNGFLQFLPQPPMSPEAITFFGGLAAAPYFFPLLKGLEVISGLMLLSNKYVSLALALLAPIVVNIFLYHITMDFAGGGAAYLTTLLTALLIKNNWNSYKYLFKA